MNQRNLLQHISLHKWFQYVYEKTATTGHDQERTQRRKGSSKEYLSNVSFNSDNLTTKFNEFTMCIFFETLHFSTMINI